MEKQHFNVIVLDFIVTLMMFSENLVVKLHSRCRRRLLEVQNRAPDIIYSPPFGSSSSPGHVYLFGCDQRQRSQQSAAILNERMKSIVSLSCGGFGIHDDTDTIWNDEYTARACRLAVGNTIELTKYVIDGKLRNGFALVRPPGHHATQKPLGFCYFNTVAITAKYLKKHRNLERIAIVDWDIHHGNGTQDLTYDDPNILYISLHRYDNGTYFPGGGRIDEVGASGSDDEARCSSVCLSLVRLR